MNVSYYIPYLYQNMTFALENTCLRLHFVHKFLFKNVCVAGSSCQLNNSRPKVGTQPLGMNIFLTGKSMQRSGRDSGIFSNILYISNIPIPLNLQTGKKANVFKNSFRSSAVDSTTRLRAIVHVKVQDFSSSSHTPV